MMVMLTIDNKDYEFVILPLIPSQTSRHVACTLSITFSVRLH